MLRQLASRQKTIDARIAALQAEAETVQFDMVQASARSEKFRAADAKSSYSADDHTGEQT